MESYRPKKNLALVLSGGGARGFAHIGVLEVLEENKIPIDAIVGTSIGALVGGVYLAGAMNEFKETALQLKPEDLAKLLISKPRKEGLTEGIAISNVLKGIIKGKRIESLPIPFIAISADLKTGGTVPMDSGDLLTAIRASISIPGLFVPVHDKDFVLVDGSIVDPLPIDIGRKIAQRLIIVDVIPMSHHFEKERSREIVEILEDSLSIIEEKMANLVYRKKKKTEIIIKPDVSDIFLLQFHKAREAIEAGRKAAMRALPKIRELLKME